MKNMRQAEEDDEARRTTEPPEKQNDDTDESAAEMAAEAGVKQLFLVHVGPEVSSPEGRVEGVKEIRTVFDGAVTMTDEMETYDWHRHGHTVGELEPDPVAHPHIHRHT